MDTSNITIVNKSIFDAFIQNEIQILAHQANCFHTMGAGIARKIKYTFPEAYKADCNTKYADKNKLGTLSYAFYPHSSKYVVNLYGQYRYGREKQHTCYQSLTNSLLMLKSYRQSWSDELGKPLYLGLNYKIGCNNAGGDWNIVYNIINSVFSDISPFCKIYNPNT